VLRVAVLHSTSKCRSSWSTLISVRLVGDVSRLVATDSDDFSCLSVRVICVPVHSHLCMSQLRRV